MSKKQGYHPLQYWDMRALQMEKDKSELPDYLREEFNVLLDWLAHYDLFDKRFLEIGVGTGAWVSHLIDAKFPAKEIVGCDISAEFIRICKARTKIEIKKWNGQALPYLKRSSDIVGCVNLFLHVPPRGIHNLLSEVVRCSKRYVMVTSLTSVKKGVVLAKHCFMHDYAKLWKEYNLDIKAEKTIGNRTMWLLEKKYWREKEMVQE